MPSRDKRPPDFMDIEIKFSGRTDTIRAYFDDDPYDLAEVINFHQHCLSYPNCQLTVPSDAGLCGETPPEAKSCSSYRGLYPR